MKKYTQDELQAIADKLLKDRAVVYGDADATFISEAKYEKLKGDEKKAFTKYESKTFKAATAAGDPEAEKKLAEATETIGKLEKEIERLNGLKSVKEAKEALAEKDKVIAELEEKLKATQPAQ
jgi:hypothetical protein